MCVIWQKGNIKVYIQPQAQVQVVREIVFLFFNLFFFLVVVVLVGK